MQNHRCGRGCSNTASCSCSATSPATSPTSSSNSRRQNDGLLSYEWKESTQGPPRKYYMLTNQGQIVLIQLDEAWGEIENTVSLLRDKNTTTNSLQ